MRLHSLFVNYTLGTYGYETWSHVKMGTEIQSLEEEGTEEDIQTDECESNRRVEKNCLVRSLMDCTARKISPG
jgi:hypothetical protein